MRKKINANITALVGKTPVVYLQVLGRGLPARVAAKLEYLNPGGSVKDRAALNMILDAEKRGFIKSGTTIVEPSCGNFGISLAMVCAARGYRLLLTMPDTTECNRINLFHAYGAEVVTTPGQEGMKGAIVKAALLAESLPDAFMPDQFSNPSNPEAHEKTTTLEIWDDTNGEIDILVAGIGTGGTITGLAKGLRRKKKDIRIIGIEPESSPVLSRGKAGKHKIPGISPGFVPRVLNRESLNEIILVSDQDALETAKRLQREEGIPAGLSSGAAAWAALELAKQEQNEGKLIVVIFPDSSEKYINMGLFK